MFRFTIRDVLWLMVVVGMGLGWWNAAVGLPGSLSEEKRNTRLWKDRAEYLADHLRDRDYYVEFHSDGKVIVTVRAPPLIGQRR